MPELSTEPPIKSADECKSPLFVIVALINLVLFKVPSLTKEVWLIVALFLTLPEKTVFPSPVTEALFSMASVVPPIIFKVSLFTIFAVI